MMRFAAAALIALAATSAAAQTAPSLRATVLVAGDLVRIGDLVESVTPDKAEIAVFRAPGLGETGSVRVAAVIAALRPHDVVGIETPGFNEVSVTRASRMIGAAEIKSRIADMAAERLRVTSPDNIEVRLDGPVPTIHLDPNETGPLIPMRTNYDNRSGKFELHFRTGATQLRVTGTAHEALEAVVLTRAVARGDVLRASDVAVERRLRHELQGEMLQDPSVAVGMASQQSLRAGQPLRTTDLVKPQVVKRSEPVMLFYEVPGISLTARGKAEDTGAVGDTVNVLNIQSKRIVQGIVTGPGQVTVASFTMRAIADNRASSHVATAGTAQTKAE
jgi:flagellar basal body P-ring formation protein FlgA